MTNNTPNKFPNKSLNSKALTGIIKCNSSKNIDKKNKYIIMIFILESFLYARIPNKERTINA